MSQVYVKVDMFKLPNFMRITDAGIDAPMLDVGHLFPTDQEAAEFWNEVATKWIEHVAKRRNSLSAFDQSSTGDQK